MLLICPNRKLSCCSLPYRRGADVNAVNWLYERAMSYAARKDNNLDVIRLLAECGADINARVKHLEDGRMDVVQFIVEFGADVNASNSLGQTPLMHGGTSGILDIAKYLVKSVPMSIWLEIRSGRHCVMRFMNGADIDVEEEKGWTSLMLAAWKNDLETVQLLV
ncbi:Pfs domain-containing hypothetical protein [Phytophthora megakarya]|uniref:TKL protein kinase n=1 Tax=Phytophthora megakarya TaxID=4795 RepID=A0A225V398_9STRA|nr:Pfs domain-containing hypothetical protein [Phytophthora megakarya]